MMNGGGLSAEVLARQGVRIFFLLCGGRPSARPAAWEEWLAQLRARDDACEAEIAPRPRRPSRVGAGT